MSTFTLHNTQAYTCGKMGDRGEINNVYSGQIKTTFLEVSLYKVAKNLCTRSQKSVSSKKHWVTVTEKIHFAFLPNSCFFSFSFHQHPIWPVLTKQRGWCGNPIARTLICTHTRHNFTSKLYIERFRIKNSFYH